MISKKPIVNVAGDFLPILEAGRNSCYPFGERMGVFLAEF